MLVDILNDAKSKVLTNLQEDNLSMIMYLKQTKVDVDTNNKELFKIAPRTNRHYLRSKNETADNFDVMGKSYYYSDLNPKRFKGIGYRYLAVKKYYTKIKRGTLKEKEYAVLSKFFAGILIFTSRKLTFTNFIKKEVKEYERRSVYSLDGFYYNERFGDKDLVFFEHGFFSTYTHCCEWCNKKDIIAYKDNTSFTKVGERYYCDSCLKENNYGECDVSHILGFRVKLKFSCDEDRKEVMKKLRIKDENLNINPNFLREKGIIQCSCGNWFLKKTNNSFYCSDCKLSRIEDYGTKNYHICKCRNEINPKEFFGFELETEVKGYITKCAKIVNKGLKDLVICKRDGSIDDGFEIVSQTLTYKKYLKERKRIDNVLKEAVKEGCYSQSANTTGLHIHIARSGFDDAGHLARFCQTWYLFKDLTKYIAQRSFGNYREWHESIAEDKEFFKKFLGSNLYKTHERSARYRIVNLNNSNTVEIRIFKGIMSEKYLSICMEICKLLKDYSKNDIDAKTIIPYLLKKGSLRVKNFIKLFEIQRRYGIQEA